MFNIYSRRACNFDICCELCAALVGPTCNGHVEGCHPLQAGLKLLPPEEDNCSRQLSACRSDYTPHERSSWCCMQYAIASNELSSWVACEATHMLQTAADELRQYAEQLQLPAMRTQG